MRNILHILGGLFIASYLSIAWDKIPEISLEAGNILEFYKTITPPVVVIILCAFFIKDHLSVKAEFDDLKAL